ncbi:hypothetical protein ERJ75_001058700 [Trypanosoma vivax]|uniref:Uncharacterized protein n=1 Tax=Trypanosoma vivax (strain Y486) TaxID=1055687 RepID=G0U0I4_TRYVY|nr:hypothetical protein TRVL_07017 [Trypanosoma vivax]KAH8610970.1 hypothetical protein ERJ75_001058700 [Trypanosoma vivax]CCC49583.1 conserved hypothetical protein [Trypanosoma vivax Y486]
MKWPSRRQVGYVCTVALVVLLGVVFLRYPGVGSSVFTRLSMNIRKTLQLARNANRFVGDVVPLEVQPHLKQFLAGATSVALFGHGIRIVPGVADIISVDASKNTTLAAARERERKMTTLIMAQPVEKLFYAVGGIVANILLVRLLVQPRWSPGFSMGHHRKYHPFVTHIGWLLLVVSIAIPNGLVDMGLLIALFARLSMSTFGPALIIGKLAQPYVVAALCYTPLTQYARLLNPYFASVLFEGVSGSVGDGEPYVGVLMWVSAVAAVHLFSARLIYPVYLRHATSPELMPEQEDATR